MSLSATFLIRHLLVRRQDFPPGGRRWQEHPDDTFERPSSWGPEPVWINQVLLLGRHVPKLVSHDGLSRACRACLLINAYFPQAS